MHAVEAGYSAETEAAELVLARPRFWHPSLVHIPWPMTCECAYVVRHVCTQSFGSSICSTNDQESQIPDANHPRLWSEMHGHGNHKAVAVKHEGAIQEPMQSTEK